MKQEICAVQEKCPSYKWGHKIRSHHVRENEQCEHYNKDCPELDGQSCDLSKIRRLKKK